MPLKSGGHKVQEPGFAPPETQSLNPNLNFPESPMEIEEEDGLVQARATSPRQPHAQDTQIPARP